MILFNLKKYALEENWYSLGVADSPDTSSEILAKILGKGNDDLVSRYAANNPNCPPKILVEILRKGKDDGVSRGAASNPNCPPEALAEVLIGGIKGRRDDDLVLCYAVSNPKCPSEVLVKILKRKKIDAVSYYAAENPNCPPEMLTEILRRKSDDNVSRNAAQNPKCPPEMLAEVLRRGEDDEVSQSVLKNPNCPPLEKIKWMKQFGYITQFDPQKHILEEVPEENEGKDLKKLEELITQAKRSRLMTWYKKAQEHIIPKPTNPLNGKAKPSARNYIYRLVGDMTRGFFRDNSWENVSAIWNKLNQNGIDNYVTKAEYVHNERGEPSGKVWHFEIPFVNQRGKNDALIGTLTASFAGSVKDPSDRYDISFVI